jgi:hypothetical protein
MTMAVRQGGRRQRPGQRRFGVDARGKGRLNTQCKSKTMKTKICLLGFFALVTLAIAAPHTWTFQKGGTFEGDYYSSGTTAVVVRKNGTNYIFKIADLSTNDLAYVTKMKADQKQAQLDAEMKQMVAAGMIELSARLIKNFPEKVRNQQKGWMDVTFDRLSTAHIAFPDMQLGLDVTDKNDEVFYKCVIFKQLNRPDENTQPVPNPLASWALGLMPGDKIRLIGHCYPDTASGKFDANSSFDYAGFLVEKIEVMETAAEKKAREQTAESP